MEFFEVVWSLITAIVVIIMICAPAIILFDEEKFSQTPITVLIIEWLLIAFAMWKSMGN